MITQPCVGIENKKSTTQRKNLTSGFAIGAIEDLGYTVDYSAADDYGYDDLGSECQCNRTRRLGAGDMEETLPLELSEHGNRHRRPSDEAQEKAKAEGLKFLKEAFPPMPQGRAYSGVFPWRRSVVVFFQDEYGDIFDVHVVEDQE